MRKILGLFVLATILLTVSFASASTTIIAGKIYNADYSGVINGANVKVTCGVNEIDTSSLPDGSYNVKFTDVCVDGDTLTVSATSGSLSGSKTGKIKETCGPSDKDNNCLITISDDVSIAVVNVPLVPEFGTIVGIVTALGALGVFFVVRRK